MAGGGGGGGGCFPAFERVELDVLTDGTNLDGALWTHLDSGLLYVGAQAADRMTVVDVSDPTSMSVVGSFQSSTTINNHGVLTKVGNNVYIRALNAAATQQTLTVLDVTTPSAPSSLGSLASSTFGTAASGVGIVVDGNYAYCPSNARICVVNVSNPASMTITALIDNVNFVSPGRLVKSGSTLFVIDNAISTLHAVDVSTPTAPTFISSLFNNPQTIGVRDIIRDGNICYLLAANTNRVTAVDVSNPASMTIISSLLTNATLMNQMVKVGDFLYITRTSGLVIVDVSDPSNMVQVDSFANLTAGSPLHIQIEGDAAFVTVPISDRVVSYGLDDCAEVCANVVGSVTSSNLDAAAGVDVAGDFAYVAAVQADRLVVVDVSDPTTPTIAGSVTHATQLNGAQVVRYHQGNCFVMVPLEDRLTVVDVTTPSSPSILTSLADSALDDARGIYLDAANDLLYVTLFTTDGITVIDISTPSSPSILGSFTHANLADARGIWVASGLAFIGGAQRLTVVDVSNPASMSHVGSVSSITELVGGLDVVKSGNYCYVTAFDSAAVTVVDVSTPSSPSVVESLPLNAPFSVVKDGVYLYVTQPSLDAVAIIDATTPTALALVGDVGSSTVLDVTQYIAKQGDYLYVNSSGADRLSVISLDCGGGGSAGWTVG